MIFLRLFWEFFKTGLFSVGGGLATLPFLYEMGPRTGWFTAGQVSDMLAVSESTPGPIGVNMAVYTGFTTAGPLGSVCALAGLVTPSVIIILLVAAFLKAFRHNRYVNGAFYGLRPASTGLIAAAGLSVAVDALLRTEAWEGVSRFWTAVRWPAILLAAAVFFLSRRFQKLHPAILILGCAVVGAVFRFAGA
ncbi:MAG: chromate transporter [Oscillospiraceae bacterium]|nr:chromate transporter [Oscillospiraceae bacterium]